MGRIPLKTPTNMDHQTTRRTTPTMITTTPMMTPNTFDTEITSFERNF
jgi:hypothetical protein